MIGGCHTCACPFDRATGAGGRRPDQASTWLVCRPAPLARAALWPHPQSCNIDPSANIYGQKSAEMSGPTPHSQTQLRVGREERTTKHAKAAKTVEPTIVEITAVKWLAFGHHLEIERKRSGTHSAGFAYFVVERIRRPTMRCSGG